MNDTIRNWYPIYTRSRAEKATQIELDKLGIQTYLPLRKVEKQWSDRKKIIEEPLLKSYLFVYITVAEQSLVRETYGVSRFIYFSGQIATIPNKQIEDLQLLLAKQEDLELIAYPLQKGEKVLIKAGPFKGIIAELVAIKSKYSLILRLENLGYAIDIKTSMAYIEPLK